MMLGVRDGDCDRLGVRVRLGEPEVDSVPDTLGLDEGLGEVDELGVGVAEPLCDWLGDTVSLGD